METNEVKPLFTSQEDQNDGEEPYISSSLVNLSSSLPQLQTDNIDVNLSKRKLIVNYLPQTYTDFELRNLFAPFGVIESVRIMKDSKTGYSFGYGFVNFIREVDGITAQEQMHGFELQSKKIKVSFARPPSDDNKHTNLYITNLPRDMNESHLLEMFRPYGKIVHTKLLFDKYTKLPRGVAFVRYEKREQASSAIVAFQDFIPDGQLEPIRIKLAEEHGKQKASYLAGFQAGMGISRTHVNRHQNHNQDCFDFSGGVNSSGSHGGGKWKTKRDDRDRTSRSRSSRR